MRRKIGMLMRSINFGDRRLFLFSNQLWYQSDGLSSLFSVTFRCTLVSSSVTWNYFLFLIPPLYVLIMYFQCVYSCLINEINSSGLKVACLISNSSGYSAWLAPRIKEDIYSHESTLLIGHLARWKIVFDNPECAHTGNMQVKLWEEKCVDKNRRMWKRKKKIASN